MGQKTSRYGTDSLPIVSILLTIATLFSSISVSQIVNNTPFSNVPIVELATWGGIKFSELDRSNLWRIFTAQLVHVKWPHMIYNAACLFLVGALVEKQIGGLWVLLVWVLIGRISTLISPIFGGIYSAFPFRQ